MKKPQIAIFSDPAMRVPKKKITEVSQLLFKKFKNHKKIKALKQKTTSDHLTFVFLNEKKARLCNKTFRNKDYATDILSFEPVMGGESLGELVFCYPVLKRQAKEHDLSFQSEIIYLVIHGFLHLLGYDHEKSKKEEALMMRLQDSLFERIQKCR